MDANYAAQLNSQAISAKAYGVEPSSDTFTENMVSRLNAVLSTLGEPDNDLSMLRDRLFGPVAETQAGNHGVAGGPINSRAEILFELVESLQRRASSVASLARGLNSRI